MTSASTIQKNLSNTTSEVKLKLSPLEPYRWFNEIMKFSLITDLMVLYLLLLYHTKQYFLPESEHLWPLHQMFAFHRYLMIINALISAWKGWKIDNQLFYAVHHIITYMFFYYTTGYPISASIRYMIGMLIYSTMRIVKRMKDDLEMTKEHWLKFYAYYTYTQVCVSFYFVVFRSHDAKLVDVIGSIALIDSLYTCRKEDIGTHLLKRLPIYIRREFLDNKISHMLISIIDVVSIWMLALLPVYFNTVKPHNLYSLFDSFKGLIVFGIVDLFIKRLPIFRKFKRPHNYDFTKSGSFPSAHIIVTIVATNILSPILRTLIVILMGLYRVTSHSHTLDDVCAGIVFGNMFDIIWLLIKTSIM
jgi:hypothetical protein